MHHQFFQKRRNIQRLSFLPIWSELFKIKNWTDMQLATFYATFSKQNFECFVFGFERADWLRIQCAGKKQCSVFYWYVKKIKQHSLRWPCRSHCEIRYLFILGIAKFVNRDWPFPSVIFLSPLPRIVRIVIGDSQNCHHSFVVSM